MNEVLLLIVLAGAVFVYLNGAKTNETAAQAVYVASDRARGQSSVSLLKRHVFFFSLVI